MHRLHHVTRGPLGRGAWPGTIGEGMTALGARLNPPWESDYTALELARALRGSIDSGPRSLDDAADQARTAQNSKLNGSARQVARSDARKSGIGNAHIRLRRRRWPSRLQSAIGHTLDCRDLAWRNHEGGDVDL